MVQLKTESEMLTSNARALIRAGKKDRAMMCLKIKKMKVQKCDEADNQLLKLTEMVCSNSRPVMDLF